MADEVTLTSEQPAASEKKELIGDEEIEACSVETFCRRHGISVATYYNLRLKGLAPRETIIGGRTLISKEAAGRWRRQRERKAITTSIRKQHGHVSGRTRGRTPATA